jgi:hypothetical protein
MSDFEGSCGPYLLGPGLGDLRLGALVVQSSWVPRHTPAQTSNADQQMPFRNR